MLKKYILLAVFLIMISGPLKAEKTTTNLDEAMAISLSGILAQKLHLELIASNIANINVTRTLTGGPYKRQVAIFASDFEPGTGKLKGVRLSNIVEDPTPCKRVYNPGHPDADAEGYVLMPNVEVSSEMMDLIFATRLYEANITVFNAAKQLANTTFDLSR
jgi:flagellar basal-body rod protein FlgC